MTPPIVPSKTEIRYKMFGKGSEILPKTANCTHKKSNSTVNSDVINPTKIPLLLNRVPIKYPAIMQTTETVSQK